MKRIAICLLLFMSIFTLGCSMVDKKITKQFEKYHEEDMKTAVAAFHTYVDTTEKFYSLNQDEIIISEEFTNKVNNILTLHNEHHNHEALPRDSEEWNTWMHYKKEPNPKKTKDFLTVCPFCLAEEDGKLKEDNSWVDTNLFTYKIDKRINDLLVLMKNEEIKGLLQELENHFESKAPFSETNSSNKIIGMEHNENKYYVLLTPKYREIRNKIKEIHDNFHKFYAFDPSLVDTIFHYKEITSNRYLDTSNPITCCPVCVVRDDKIQDGSFTEDMESLSWQHTDEYIWKQGNFATTLFDKYAMQRSEEKKVAAEKRRIQQMPITTMEDIYSYFRKGESHAHSELRGKQVKVRASVVMTDGKKAFIGDMYPVILPQEDYDQLYGRDFAEITFVGTIFVNNQIMEGSIGFRDCQVLNIRDLW